MASSFCKDRRCERWSDLKIRVPSVPNVPPVHKYTWYTSFWVSVVISFELGITKAKFQPGFSKEMKTAKNFPCLRMDFTKTCFSEMCIGCAGRCVFTLFCARSHETVKPDMPTYGQDIAGDSLSGFSEQEIFHQSVKRERPIVYRLHPTTNKKMEVLSI